MRIRERRVRARPLNIGLGHSYEHEPTAGIGGRADTTALRIARRLRPPQGLAGTDQDQVAGIGIAIASRAASDTSACGQIGLCQIALQPGASGPHPTPAPDAAERRRGRPQRRRPHSHPEGSAEAQAFTAVSFGVARVVRRGLSRSSRCAVSESVGRNPGSSDRQARDEGGWSH